MSLEGIMSYPSATLRNYGLSPVFSKICLVEFVLFFIQVLLAERNVRCESLDDEAGCVDKDASNCRPLWQFGITRGRVNLFTPIHPQTCLRNSFILKYFL